MRALTLTQPWCGLVSCGLKPVENRSRPLIRPEDFGRPFALHASKEIDEDVFDIIFRIAPELRALPLAPWRRLARVTGAVLSVAVVDRAVTWRGSDPRSRVVVDYHTGERVELGGRARWLFGRVGYVLRGEPVLLSRPVRCPGRLGFWTLPDHVAMQVEAQLIDWTGALACAGAAA
jgi:hypothetical protein